MSGSGISWAICKSAPRSRQMTTPASHYSVFYRPDALPAAQPTASKHWRHSLSLTSVKSRLVLLFWYWLTWVVPDKGPLNLCVCCRFSDEEKTEEKEGRQRQGSWVSSECELLVIWGAEWQMWWKLSHNNYEYQFSEKKINCVCKLIKSFVLCCDFSQETDAANSEMVCYVNSFFIWLSESIFHLANRFTVSCTSQVEINQPFHISCNQRLLNNYVSRHVVFIMLCGVLFV